MSAVRAIEEGKAEICRAVLDDLPDWFGRPQAVEDYCAAARQLPMLAAYAGDMVAGFASLGAPSRAATEIHVMGVRRTHHRQGLGRALVAAARAHAFARGAALLMVKTLGPSFADASYEATRRFYEAVGFLPLEEIPDFWGKGTPALIFVMPLGPAPISPPDARRR